MINVNGYSFEGPFSTTHPLKSISGVYLILDQRPDDYYTVDCGEAHDVKDRVSNHDRKACWHHRSTGRLVVAAHYVQGELKRRAVEQAIRTSLPFPCGKR